MFDTPEAPPTCAGGTAAVAPEDDGPLESPMPTAIATRGRKNAAYPHEPSTKPTTTNPAVLIANPAAMTGRAPKRPLSAGMNGDTATRPAVAGSVARPACSGENPSVASFWKYRLNRYIRPLIVPAPIRMAMVVPTSTRLCSSARSRRGTLTRPSTRMNATPAITVTAKQPNVAAENQPQSPLLLTPRMSGIRVSATSTVPA